MAERAAPMRAHEWRAFWRERGLHELRALLSTAWDPAGDAPPGACDPHAFRIVSLLGSRASRVAIAAELGRIRRDELSLEPDPAHDAAAADRIATWFEGVPR